MVFVDKNGQPTIAHRGSVTAKDWLVNDVLIAAGAHRETERLRRARQITAAAELKYQKKSNAVGHSLGGRLAERSGSGGEVVTFNKAAGLGDINGRLPNASGIYDEQRYFNREQSGARGGDRGGQREHPVELTSMLFISFEALGVCCRVAHPPAFVDLDEMVIHFKMKMSVVIKTTGYKSALSPLNIDQTNSRSPAPLVLSMTPEKTSEEVADDASTNRVVATSAFDPTVVTSIATKANPTFTSVTSVTTTSDEQTANGWSATSSSFSSGKDAWWGFDGTGNQWVSAGGFNGSTRFGNQWLQIKKLQPGSNESAMVVDLKLHTGWSVGRISLMSARPLIMGDTSGSPVSMLDTPVAWEYNIILSRGGQVVNTGLYRFAPPGVKLEKKRIKKKGTSTYVESIQEQRQNFGHYSLSFDPSTGKFSAVYLADPAYGTIDNVFYAVDRYFGNNVSKNGLDLLLTDQANVFWQLPMAPRELANVAPPPTCREAL
ncbi:hypothetical protein T492DRAFT_850711 [Pavlovales sp. CCMP2436]|nr:hypothetical protein T492DRAFT_850711 [Pavlovales sp. CCMP2436]